MLFLLLLGCFYTPEPETPAPDLPWEPGDIVCLTSGSPTMIFVNQAWNTSFGEYRCNTTFYDPRDADPVRNTPLTNMKVPCSFLTSCDTLRSLNERLFE